MPRLSQTTEPGRRGSFEAFRVAAVLGVLRHYPSKHGNSRREASPCSNRTYVTLPCTSNVSASSGPSESASTTVHSAPTYPAASSGSGLEHTRTMTGSPDSKRLLAAAGPTSGFSGRRRGHGPRARSAPLSRQPLDRLSEASVHRQELCPKGPGRFATTPPAAPPPLPPRPGFGCLQGDGAGTPNPGRQCFPDTLV